MAHECAGSHVLVILIRQLSECRNERLKLQPSLIRLARANESLSQPQVGLSVILNEIKPNLGFDDLLDSSVLYDVAGMKIRSLKLEVVVLSKECSNRNKDRAALPMLRRTLASMHHVDAMEQLTTKLAKFNSNKEFIELISGAKVADY